MNKIDLERIEKLHWISIFLSLIVAGMDACHSYQNNKAQEIIRKVNPMFFECFDEARYLFHRGKDTSENSKAELHWIDDCIRLKDGKKPIYEDDYRDEVNKYKMESGSLKRTQ